jgi:hypothetical protein
MNIDHIFETLNRYLVSYLLIGGMNFALRHKPILTFDVDLWIDDSKENRSACELALSDLQAEWGRTDDDWQQVSTFPAGWLERQHVFCLNSPSGPIDIFRSVEGLGSWQDSEAMATTESTISGVPYRGLSDLDMLRCQYALPESIRKIERVAILEQINRDDTSEGST